MRWKFFSFHGLKCGFFSTWSKFYIVNSLRKFHKVNYVSILARTPLAGDVHFKGNPT